ncbi:MAG: energy transducer TonB [Acidipila sp.]|nr:energy transducer TonB [Acidipila sp.]
MKRNMRNNTGIVLIFACLFLTTGVLCAGTEDATSPEELISRARLLEDIWTEGTPPMLMRAEIEVSSATGALVHGSYRLDWVSPSRWREEIRFDNYQRLRVGDAKGYWQTSARSFRPQVIFQLDTLLHLRDALRVTPKETLGKVKNRKQDRARQICTEVKWALGTSRTMCFDETSGALASIEYPGGEPHIPPEISRIEYGAFTSVAGKLVPHEIRALKDGKVIAAVRVLEIAKITEENPSLFNAPAKAEFWAQCDDMKEAEPLVGSVPPKYPKSAKDNLQTGRVILYLVVEADGSLSKVELIRGATPDLNAAALEAARQWHFSPATCGSTPIRVEKSFSTDFVLQFDGRRR